MEELLKDIRAYAAAMGLQPTTVVQNSGGGGGNIWAKWEAGGTCTLKTAEKIRKYMAENPPPAAEMQEAS